MLMQAMILRLLGLSLPFELGGDDQWNILGGVVCVRPGGGEKYTHDLPLLTTSEGKKMGKD